MGTLKNVLGSELFAGVTVLHVIAGVVGLVVALRLWELVKGKAEPEKTHYEPARCSCGWKGKVSKFTRTCPMCNNEIVRG